MVEAALRGIGCDLPAASHGSVEPAGSADRERLLALCERRVAFGLCECELLLELLAAYLDCMGCVFGGLSVLPADVASCCAVAR